MKISLRNKNLLVYSAKCSSGILLHPEGTHPWDAALNRALAAVVGGLLGWGLTYVFHAAVHIEPLAVNPGTVRRNEEA